MPSHPRTLTALAAVVLAVTACTGDGAAPDPTAGTGRSVCATADGAGPRVGLAYDVGGRGDHGLDDGAYEGMVTAVDQVDATCVEAEARRDETGSGRADLLRKLAVEGFDPVIAVGSAYADATAEVAPEFPDTSFAVVGAPPGAEGPGNVAHLVFDDAAGSHLVGAAAGAATESGILGVLGLADTPGSVVRGFRAGARAERPDVEVRVRLVERPRELRAAARAMLRDGVDVVYDVSGLPVGGVAAVAGAAGSARVIGFGTDLGSRLPPALQDVVLTSMLRRADLATLAVVRGAAEGEPLAGTQVLGVAEDGVGWADPDDVPDEVTRALEAAAERLASLGAR